MEIQPQFTFEKVRHDQDTNLHLVLNLTAPKSDWQKTRPALCVIPVLDISGSMSGDKLAYAKQSLLKLVEHLSADDYFGLVSFSSQARVDFEPTKMTPEKKDQVRAIIGRYHTEGSTNFSGGMLLGLNLANKLDLPEATIVRVIMFTDGQPTHGVTDEKGLCNLLDKQAGRASVSTFGYGKDACQDLLQNLSTKGKGNYAFVRDPDAALAAFGKELGGLLSTYAQDIVVEVAPHNGHQITEILSDVDVEEERTGEIAIKVPHILSEETVSLVLAMKLSAQKQPGPRQVNAVDVKVTFQVIEADGSVAKKTIEGKAKVQFVKPGDEQSKPTKVVDEIVARAQLVKVQVEAEKHAQSGNYAAAAASFSVFQHDMAARGVAGIGLVADHVSSYYSDAESYRSKAGNRMALRKAVARGTEAVGLVGEDMSVLRSAGLSMNTAAQENVSTSFQQAPIAAPAPIPAQTITPVPSVTPNAVMIGQPQLITSDNGMGVTGTSISLSPPNAGPEAPVPSSGSLKLTKSRSKRW